MQKNAPATSAGPAAAARLPEQLGDFSDQQQAQLLVTPPPPHLTVDCGERCAPHPLGVGCFVSYLLLLHQRGTSLRLRNVHPVFRRCLLQLGLGPLLHLNG